MSDQGVETIESTTQKTHEWIARIAEALHKEKRDASKALRSVLQTVRDRLPSDLAVHFGAQLPMLIRGLYYEGWEPARCRLRRLARNFWTPTRENCRRTRNRSVGNRAVRSVGSG
jgi:uncharacterized protein (DUF2267 family)